MPPASIDWRRYKNANGLRVYSHASLVKAHRTMYMCDVQSDGRNGRKPDLLVDSLTGSQRRRHHDDDHAQRTSNAHLLLRQPEPDDPSSPVRRHSGCRTIATPDYLDKLYTSRLTADKCASLRRDLLPVCIIEILVVLIDRGLKRNLSNVISLQLNVFLPISYNRLMKCLSSTVKPIATTAHLQTPTLHYLHLHLIFIFQ